MITGTVALPHGITARPVRNGDKNFLAKLFRDNRTDLQAIDATKDFIDMTVDMQLDAQINGYGSTFPNAIYLILEKNGSRIGRVTLDVGPIELRLIDLSFIKKAQNRGYGSAIIQWVMNAAAQTRRPLVVPARRDNSIFVTHLIKAGFQEDTSISDDVIARMVWFPTSDEMNGIGAIKPRKAASGNV
ncbi:GNAT family N-acetyltransferase [Thalassospira marina]|uniref:GNAT family N-acetyltransferase n=1 Tax=Thalassospira marina TaxID=2048283 RepID=A0A2N3KBN6_9PROT|nr:GNAT family N-acetyltransferase [Thalassospira marina]PKR47979.1 GNAT family N-acetyltransferase [Thalassospira marina]